MITFKKKIKSLLVYGLCLASIVQAIYSTMSFTLSVDYYGQLGTNQALNSPILNSQFDSENWNKWETICWGVYLSNFAIPFVDTYESAFSSGSNSGSKGYGYNALVFGSGSDDGSERILQGLLNYAIAQQMGDYEKQIYITLNEVNSDGTITRHDPVTTASVPTETEESEDEGEEDIFEEAPQSSSNIEPARVPDLFFAQKESDGRVYASYGADSVGMYNNPDYKVKTGSGVKDIVYVGKGSLPTFWVESGSGYQKVFDYTDAWDPQVFTACIVKAASGEYGDDLKEEMNKAFDENYSLVLDCFGNICARTPEGKKVIVPASSNQHLTSEPSVNLLSSTLFNGFMGNLTSNQLALGSRQMGNGGAFGIQNGKGEIPYGGLPAFGNSATTFDQGTVLCFYDLDTIMVQDYLKNGESKLSDGISYGKAMKQLLYCDINQRLGNLYPLKMETVNTYKIAEKLDPGDDSGFAVKYSTMLHTMYVSSMLANQLDNNSTRARVLSEITDTNGSKIKIFGDPVLVPVQLERGSGSGASDLSKITSHTAFRFMAKHTGTVYRKGFSNTYASVNGEDIADAFNEANSSDFLKKLTQRDGKMTDFSISFVTNYKGSLYTVNSTLNALKNSETKFSDTHMPLSFKSKNNEMKAKFESSIDGVMGSEYDNTVPGRMVLVYPISEVMRAANNYMGIKSGSEYSAYASKIYMTYLEWYGITGKGDEATSEFNERIFDDRITIKTDDLSKIIGATSAEQKEEEILNMTYLMLHPDKGREYRTNLVKNNLSDFLYSQYQTLVYGESVSYSSGNRTTTKSAGGFLDIPTLADNMLTKPFIDNYVDIVSTIIVIVLVLLVIMGVLKAKKPSWFFVSFVVAVNTFLLVPASGDIVPYLSNKIVQSMFEDKMTFWALSESIENMALEKEAVGDRTDGYLQGLTADERNQVISIVKSLSTVNLDRSLMLKRDISSKVNQKLEGSYAEIQNLKSARWLLPMIMRQYTASGGTADYVSIPIGDMYDDISHMYWYYRPEDSSTVTTLTSEQEATVADEATLELLSTRGCYPAWKDTNNVVWADDSIHYKSTCYDLHSSEELEHTYVYVIADTNMVVPSLEEYVNSQDGGYKNLDSLNGYSQYCLNSKGSVLKDNMVKLENRIEEVASSYDRADRSTVDQVFGYLWTTETPYHYFYGVVKETFDSSFNYPRLISELQGSYVVNDEGKDVRVGFMYADESGYTKDMLDLEELFVNCVPYMYQMQLLAGGDDGKGGLLEGIKISDQYGLYEGSDASWLFRCNWATKLVENPNYSKSETVTDSDGNKYTVGNPILPFTYPEERPMVFSEAQMHEQGLKESQLTLAELKCVSINKAVARRWTMLINYANTSGMEKEILLRQMTTEAVLEFNSQLSPTSILSGSYAMYPSSVDLRSLSFDSIIRMLLMNITRDSSYIHNDTMLNVISNLDMVSAIVLYIAALLCSTVIPFCRMLLMAFIFYLGIVSVIYSMFANNNYKIKKAGAQFVLNLVFMLVTVVYYWSFKVLMGVTSTDSVLTAQSIQISSGNPLWCFFIIILISIGYIVVLIWMLKFLFFNFKDMGLEVMTNIAATVQGKASDMFHKVSEGFSSFINGDSGISPGGSGSVKGTGESNKSQDVVVTDNKVKDQEVKIKDQDSESSSYTDEVSKAAAYTEGADSSRDSSKFDAEIEKGKKMES